MVYDLRITLKKGLMIAIMGALTAVMTALTGVETVDPYTTGMVTIMIAALTMVENLIKHYDDE